MSQETEKQERRTGLFEGVLRNRHYVLKASAIALAFWLLQFLFQYYVLVPGDVKLALIRSFALAGATMISAALIIGPLARLAKYNFIFHRRTIGVWGFTFIIMHFFTVMLYVFDLNPALIWIEPNPFFNPVIFGVIAFLLFVPLYLTSTDWAVDRLGFRNWKNLHRIIYFAYVFSVIHYTQTNTELLFNPAGYLLILLTIATMILQVAGFAKTVMRTKSRKALLVGILIILFAIVMLYTAFSGIFETEV